MKFCATVTLLACLAGSALATRLHDGVASLEALVQQLATGGGPTAAGIERRDLEGLEALLDHMRATTGTKRVEQRDAAGVAALQALVDVKTMKGGADEMAGETRRVEGRDVAGLEALLEHVKMMVQAGEMPETDRLGGRSGASAGGASGQTKMATDGTRMGPGSEGGTSGQTKMAADGSRTGQRAEAGTPGRGTNMPPGGSRLTQRADMPIMMPDIASQERGPDVNTLAALVADHLRATIQGNGQLGESDRIVIEAIARSMSRQTGRTIDAKMVESLLQGKMIF